MPEQGPSSWSACSCQISSGLSKSGRLFRLESNSAAFPPQSHFFSPGKPDDSFVVARPTSPRRFLSAGYLGPPSRHSTRYRASSSPLGAPFGGCLLIRMISSACAATQESKISLRFRRPRPPPSPMISENRSAADCSAASAQPGDRSHRAWCLRFLGDISRPCGQLLRDRASSFSLYR
jgi:hypothetical protein